MPQALALSPIKLSEQDDKSLGRQWRDREDNIVPLRPKVRSHDGAAYAAVNDDSPPNRGRWGPDKVPDLEVARWVGDLAAEWRAETLLASSMVETVLHPAYQRIIGLGRLAVPFVLIELRSEPNQWFWALRAMTGEDPAAEANSFAERRDAWLRWGRSRGYLSG
jgi:hypothetical protein